MTQRGKRYHVDITQKTDTAILRNKYDSERQTLPACVMLNNYDRGKTSGGLYDAQYDRGKLRVCSERARGRGERVQ